MNIMVSESDTDTVFLRPFLNILLSEFLIYMLIHTKFLLSLNLSNNRYPKKEETDIIEHRKTASGVTQQEGNPKVKNRVALVWDVE